MDPTIQTRDFAYEHSSHSTPSPTAPRHKDPYIPIALALADINHPTLIYLDPIPTPEDASRRTWFIERRLLEEAWLEKHAFLPLPKAVDRRLRQKLWQYSRHIRKGNTYSDIQVALLRMKNQNLELFVKRPRMRDAREVFAYIAAQEAFLDKHGYLPVWEAGIEERVRAERFATAMKDLEVASWEGRLVEEVGDLERVAVGLFGVVEGDLPLGTGLIPM